MKKSLNVLLLIILLFSFVGCKTEKPEVQENHNVLNVNDANYQSFIDTDKLVILFFKMHNCKYCTEMEPVIDRIAAKYVCNSIIGKMQYEDNPDLTSKFNVKSFPVTFFLKNGSVMDTLTGSREFSVVEEVVTRHESGCK